MVVCSMVLRYVGTLKPSWSPQQYNSPIKRRWTRSRPSILSW